LNKSRLIKQKSLKFLKKKNKPWVKTFHPPLRKTK